MSFVNVTLTKEELVALDAAAKSENTTRERMAIRLLVDGLASSRSSTKASAKNDGKAKEDRSSTKASAKNDGKAKED